MNNIRIVITTASGALDVSQLVKSVTWSGSKSAAPRTLAFELLDRAGSRVVLDVPKGAQCAFYLDNIELFRGVIMRQSESDKQITKLTAYDNAIYAANNRDTFVYSSKTATAIFKDICARFGWKYTAVETGYVIPELTMQTTTCMDVLWKALALTYKNTGRRFYIVSDAGVLKLIRRADNIVQWVLGDGENVSEYTRDRAIDKLSTRVALYNDKNKIVATAKDAALEKLVGVFQHAEKADTELNSAQLTQMAQWLLESKKQPEQSLSVSALGNPALISGKAVYVSIPYLGLAATYYIDADTHSFDGAKHTMKLTLNHVNDVQGADSVSFSEINGAAYETIRKGSRGDAVRTCQQLLLDKGYSLPRFGVDGIFESETLAAVRAFQRDKSLAVDGIVGPKTWAALKSSTGG